MFNNGFQTEKKVDHLSTITLAYVFQKKVVKSKNILQDSKCYLTLAVAPH